jgi:hypothetical protein
MGVFELPDNLPIVGHIDETLAAGLLLSCLRYLGIDLLPFAGMIGRGRRGSRP